jgi:hypothetical protein
LADFAATVIDGDHLHPTTLTPAFKTRQASGGATPNNRSLAPSLN